MIEAVIFKNSSFIRQQLKDSMEIDNQQQSREIKVHISRYEQRVISTFLTIFCDSNPLFLEITYLI